MTPNGDIYDRKTIEREIKLQKKCPVTREPLSLQDLRPNRAVQVQIDQGPLFRIITASNFYYHEFQIGLTFSQDNSKIIASNWHPFAPSNDQRLEHEREAPSESLSFHHELRFSQSSTEKETYLDREEILLIPMEL